MKKLLSIITLVFMISACDTEILFTIKLSDFDKKDESVLVVGRMSMEVPSCTDSETDMPSDTVFKLQKQIPYLFKGAKFLECRSENFDSIVHFELPAYIDNKKDGAATDDGMINIAFFKNEGNGPRNLVVSIPETLRANVNKFMKSNIYAKPENLHINLSIDPEGKPISFTLVGAYLDKKPVQFGSFDNNGGKFTIGIPIYGTKALLDNDQGQFGVLYGVTPKQG